MKSAIPPARIRSHAQRLGDRCRERFMSRSWCLRRSDSATMERIPPGPSRRAKVARKWMKRTTRWRRRRMVADGESRGIVGEITIRQPREHRIELTLWLAVVATEGEAQCSADLVHTDGTELSDTLPQSLLGNGNRVVQIHCAGRFHSVLFVQDYLRRHITDGRRDGRDCDGRQISNGIVGRSKLVQTDIPAGYSAGHTASASQGCDSWRPCGCFA